MTQRSLLLAFLACSFLFQGCNDNARNPDINIPDTSHHRFMDDSIYTEDTVRKYFVIDTTGYGPQWNEYERVKDLLEFHTKDTMITGSTYVATLSMGKDISSFELEKKVEAIIEPGGKVKVRDTTQEISLNMMATLEDKAPEDDPNFRIELIGGKSNRRKYDAKKNKMVWQWYVTPKKEGNQELFLSVSHVDENGIDLGSPETRRHSIMIFAARQKKGFGKNVAVFFEKYWQWLLGAIALPIFIAWFTTRRRTQHQPAQPTTNTGEKSQRKRRPK